MGKSAKRFAVGTLIAGVAGYIAGLLTAPQSGKETRQDIKETAYKSLSEAEKDLKRLHTELDSILAEVKDRSSTLSERTQKDLAKLLEKAKDTKEKAREMLSAIHEGNADDKDLHQAIKEANAAIDHLKDFLKK